jgi:signal peptidase I
MVLNKTEWQNNIRGIKVEGSSMKPLFYAGDTVLVKAVAEKEIRKGDCVVYNFEGRNLLHRVIKIDVNGVWICDDGQVMALHFVKWIDIRGRVQSSNLLKNGFPGFIYFNLKRIYRNTLCGARHQIKLIFEKPVKP